MYFRFMCVLKKIWEGGGVGWGGGEKRMGGGIKIILFVSLFILGRDIMWI